MRTSKETANKVERNTNPEARRVGEFFKNLSAEALSDFEALERISVYPANAVLFLEKDRPQGIFILHEGRIKLSISSGDGKKLILRVANPGELLDLTAVMTGVPYEMTAETQHKCNVGFIRREDFLHFLAKHPDAYQSIVRELSRNYQRACEKLRTVVLSASAPERLARLLLEWCQSGQQTESGTRVKISMTHEEIGECIGTSRETVTRTLSDFRHRDLVMLHGSTLMVSNRAALESFARA